MAALALWVGISRINVGAHFPADVLAGYLCGMASGLLANKAVMIGKCGNTDKPQRVGT